MTQFMFIEALIITLFERDKKIVEFFLKLSPCIHPTYIIAVNHRTLQQRIDFCKRNYDFYLEGEQKKVHRFMALYLQNYNAYRQIALQKVKMKCSRIKMRYYMSLNESSS